MIRHAATIAVTLCLSPSWLYGQSTIFTVNTESANVYKSPSTGSPVLGVARRGAVLEVTRVLGSWVKVVWPDAQDGTGYVHVSMGLIALGSTPVPKRGDRFTSARPTLGSASPPATAARPEHIEAGEAAASAQIPVSPINKFYGGLFATASCGTYTEHANIPARDVRSSRHFNDMLWVYGFVSGAGSVSAKAFKGTDLAGIEQYMTAYCAQYPLETIASAAQSLVSTLAR